MIVSSPNGTDFSNRFIPPESFILRACEEANLTLLQQDHVPTPGFEADTTGYYLFERQEKN